MGSDETYTLDSLTTMMANLHKTPIRSEDSYDDMQPLEKLEYTINECILLLGGSLHTGELDADILKIILAKLQLSKESIKEYNSQVEVEEYDPLRELTKIKLKGFDEKTKYVNIDFDNLFSDDQLDAYSIGIGNKNAIGKIKIKSK